MSTAKAISASRAISPIKVDYEGWMRHSPEPTFVLDSRGNFVFCNDAFCAAYGFNPEALTGSPISALGERSKGSSARGSRRLEYAAIKDSGLYEDMALVDNSGNSRIVELCVRSDGEWTICSTRELTQKKEIQEQLMQKHQELREAYVELEKKTTELQNTQQTLVQAGKMAALGELAAGIAHELNQPLTGIRGYAQELQVIMKDAPEDLRGHLGEIVSGADKMASIIGYLRTFTRKSTEKFEWADVNFAIEEALKMLSRQYQSRGIVVTREMPADLPKVYAIPLQLEQVFINLASNARDAIDSTQRGTGTVKITTRDVEQFVEVRFQDNGCGMNEKTKTKIFNPFFTTKEVGKGMGLGLSLSYGILSKLHASIVVESEIGKGTTFVIRIPKDFRELG